jgi:dual specificity tyrosine-phosphorylation-regulated kinase 2/3/4
MWSLGCVIAELVTSVPLFPAHNEHELMEFHQLFCGPYPQEMVRKSGNRKKLFSEESEMFFLKPVPKSRIADRPPGTTSIVKSLFYKKKSKKLIEALGKSYTADMDDRLILEHID